MRSHRHNDRLSALVREAPVPGAAEAERRSWDVVRTAFEETPRPVAPRPKARTAVAIAVGAIVAGALALTPAGADVIDLIRDAVDPGVEPAEPQLSSLPAGGEVLVESGDGVWIVRSDGSKRRLGDYEQASWSPNGLYVAVSLGHTLTAVEPDGDVRWSLSRPEPIADPRWSKAPGVRVAYRAGPDLRVVAGDGTTDNLARTLIADRVAPVPPAWRPVFEFKLAPELPVEGVHVLAYALERGGIEVADTDTGEVLWRPRLPPGQSVRELNWSTDGTALLVRTSGAVYELREGSATATRVPLREGTVPTAAAFSPGGAIAVASAAGVGELKSAELVVAGGDRPRRLVAGLPGTFTDVAWSPDGRWLLVAWREADQWLFINAERPRQIEAVGGIGEQFDPGGVSANADFPALSGWVLPDRAP